MSAPPGRARSSSPTPPTPREHKTRSQLETSVSLHQDGLYFRAGTGSATLYNKRGSGTLPENPPSDQAIGDMVLNGWIGALQGQERERQSTLDGLINTRQQHCETTTTTPRKKPSTNSPCASPPSSPATSPTPTTRTWPRSPPRSPRASQRVEAKLKANADYVAAATKVKILAAKWQRRYAAWDDECSALARTLTEHHFQPFIVYEIRYTPIGAPAAIIDEEGNPVLATEEIYTLQSPLDIANEGQAIMVNTLDYKAQPNVIIIGAFLDGRHQTQRQDATCRQLRSPLLSLAPDRAERLLRQLPANHEQSHGRRDHGHALLSPAAGAVPRHGARRS